MAGPQLRITGGDLRWEVSTPPFVLPERAVTVARALQSTSLMRSRGGGVVRATYEVHDADVVCLMEQVANLAMEEEGPRPTRR